MRLLAERMQPLRAHLPKFLVRHRKNNAVVRTNLRPRNRCQAVLVLSLLSVDPWIEHIDIDMILDELANYIDHAGIAQVRAVFLEGKSHEQDPRTFDQDAALDHCLD